MGETFRTLRTRVQEHMSQSSSFVYKHFVSIHTTTPQIRRMSVDILGAGYADTHQRKDAESRFIRDTKPDIHIMGGQLDFAV